MNAVVALCHFCEQHGPSVMFCSEKGGMTPPIEEKLESLPEMTTSQDIPLGTSYADSVMSAELSRPCSRQSSAKRSLCQACKSLPDENKGFISYDSNAEEVYVSSQQPQNPNVFSKVRQACIRSLSCEVCPTREGPIFYGDENDGYVLSYTFYLKDSLARGFQRRCSIIVVMMDRIYLMQSWPFLVECIGKIIAYLQKCAASVYSAESAECPPRSQRQKTAVTKTVTPQNFRLSRSSQSNARALVELTGEKQLYPYLHAAFTWLMRASKLRWKENITTITTADHAPENLFEEASSVGHEGPAFTSLRHMREVLQPPLFRAIVWHLLIGNQVIWRGQKSVVSSAIRLLAEILPQGCGRIIEWTDTFVKESNLLGLSGNSPMPHIRYKEFIIIDAAVKCPLKEDSHFSSNTGGRRLDNANIDIRMNSGCIIPEKGPSLLGKLEVALSNENLSDEVVKDCLACLKQEWINKTKILHKFVIDKRDKEDTNDLLQNCLYCNDDDVRMMRFWIKMFAKPIQ